MDSESTAYHLRPRERATSKAIAAGVALGLTTKTISLGSGECAYVDEGEGPAVLLLHGAPVTSLSFLRVIRALRTHHQVLAPDFPGWGNSTQAPEFVPSLESYAEFVHEFVTALRLQDYYVFVNDSSACIGMSAVGKAPEAVAGIVVADTVPVPLTGRAWPVKLVLKYVVSSRFIRFLNRHLNLVPWMVICVAPMLRAFSAKERAVLLAQFDTPQKRDRILDVFRQMGTNETFMQRTANTIRAHLAKIPALILYGQFDPMRFVGGPKRYGQLFERSSLRIVPYEEHFPVLGSGERVGQIIHEWISSLPARRQERKSAP